MENLLSGFIGAIIGSIFGAVITGFFAYCISKFEIKNQIKDELKSSLFNGLQIINLISKFDIIDTAKSWEFDDKILKLQYDLMIFIQDDEYIYIRKELWDSINSIISLHTETCEFKKNFTINYITSVNGSYSETTDYSKILNDKEYKDALIMEFMNNQAFFNSKKAEYSKIRDKILWKINKNSSFYSVFNTACNDLSKFDD